MTTTHRLTRFVADLAGHWTDPALEILKDAGVRRISVDMELETWQSLKDVLHSELRWQRSFRTSTRVSLGTLMEQVLRKAALRIARKFAPASRELENRIRDSPADRRTNAAERSLYAQMVEQPALRAAFKLPSRTDYFPRLRVTAL